MAHGGLTTTDGQPTPFLGCARTTILPYPTTSILWYPTSAGHDAARLGEYRAPAPSQDVQHHNINYRDMFATDPLSRTNLVTDNQRWLAQV